MERQAEDKQLVGKNNDYTPGGFYFANTFWAEAEGCGSLKDQLKCLSMELCCLKHLEQLLLYFGSQQIQN